MVRIRKVELLGYHGSKCPHCGEEIAVPEFRRNPITFEEMRRETQAYVQEQQEKRRKRK